MDLASAGADFSDFSMVVVLDPTRRWSAAKAALPLDRRVA
jgi:hypothetical protein